jgi:hypothetical protein
MDSFQFEIQIEGLGDVDEVEWKLVRYWEAFK